MVGKASEKTLADILAALGGSVVVTSTIKDAQTADVAIQAAAAGLRYFGFSVKETAATPATAIFILRNGNDATDPPIEQVTLNPSESAGAWRAPGVDAADGIYLDMISGEIDLVVYHATVT